MQNTAATITRRLATELGVRDAQITATMTLLDGGATVPFIARYRKEATGGLDDVQLRQLDERLTYLRELEGRRDTVLAAIDKQGKLTESLRGKILAADTKTRLEDLYAPYKTKRRTKAEIARERGLQPLADQLFTDPTQDPQVLAQQFVDPAREIADIEAALEGAQQILMEQFAEDAELVGVLRERVWQRAEIRSVLASKNKADEGAKFRDWFDHAEPLCRVPSHRALAFLRGRSEGTLRLRLRLDPEDSNLGTDSKGVCSGQLLERFQIRAAGRPADTWLVETAQLAWRLKVATRLETDLITRLRESAEEEAIKVFGRNLHDLLLAAPAGHRTILGLDPGLRTGVKVAVVDHTGKVVDTATIYPTPPRRDVAGSLRVLEALVHKHDVDLVSIGNGTGSRETDRVVVELIRQIKDRRLQKIVTNEAGASVYSASELASSELPDLDVALRGAVSIARRVQDPLAELVKIEPKSIGVGQYQHDVSQSRLGRALDGVVEDCVNKVGVDVNTASPALLSHVSGLSSTLAKSIVAYRNQHGAFTSRQQIHKVPRLGPKAFEQAAGFLRIPDAKDPLDGSAVHPEAYPLVRRIEQVTGRTVDKLIGDATALQAIDAEQFIDEQFGLPTVRDILSELEKPGRDPRPDFKAANLQENIEELSDLNPGMLLEGTVTNVTNFGAFVDVGVHQDGLVHISQLSRNFVEDPHAVVKAGQVVKVKVLEVDLERRRASLTMRLDEAVADGESRGQDQSRDKSAGAAQGRGRRPPAKASGKRQSVDETAPNNAFARAFDKLKREQS